MKKLFLYIGAAVMIFYFIYTLVFHWRLSKTSVFTGGRKTFHMLMIWLIPFIWILLLKAFFKPVPGSHQIPNRREPEAFTDDGIPLEPSDPS
jgi:hypothetical protein